MQAKKSDAASERTKLIAALNAAAREASGLGVLLSETVARGLGLNPTDLECLDVVARNDRATAGDLAAATGLTTGAVTGVIDRLERAGFAHRERDEADRRKVYVRPVRAALKRAETYYGSFGAAIDALAERYTDAEIALIVDYFSRTRDVALRQIEKVKAMHAPLGKSAHRKA